jgi:tRNA (guanine-N7-)-methyltransferase
MDVEAGYPERPAWRPETRYEVRGKREGHEIYDLAYRRAA